MCLQTAELRLIGLAPGTLQWLVLRRRVHRAGWWPVASLGGFLVGFGGGFAVVRWGMVNVVHWLRPEDFPSAKALVLVGAVTGTLYGAVTWPTLARLLRRAAPAAGGARTAEPRARGHQHRATERPWANNSAGAAGGPEHAGRVGSLTGAPGACVPRHSSTFRHATGPARP
jgi:hypothetical protein